ncbi:MAG TPA: D-alanyl-D-alanine carboxypeptidase family protein [Bacillota bacterium]|nr:D-alanyl-D-alanine carboxypeptidase family protein [Bacillota bacterium]
MLWLCCQPAAYALESPAGLGGDGGEAMILVEEHSGKVLYEKNERQLMYPASTTKIMTALLLLEHVAPQETVTVGEEILLIGPDSSNAGLAVGDKISAADLLGAMLIPSGNDAAYAAAVYIARQASARPGMPTPEALQYFANMMNDRARGLGALNTHFVNPDGYHHPDHYSSAYDLSLISRAALQNELFRRAVQAPVYEATIIRHGEPLSLTWYNTNLLLHRQMPQYYPRATGLKTGYTPQAGSNLVATATDGELDLLAVILNSSDEGRWQEAVALFDYGFSHFQSFSVVEKGQVVATAALSGQSKGEKAEVPALAGTGYEDILSVEEISRLEQIITWDSRLLSGKDKTRLKAPLKEGQVIGLARYILDGQVLFETELLSGSAVRARFPWEKYLAPALLLPLLFVIIKRRQRIASPSRRRRRF